jgi:hypothetical protein
MPQIGQLPGSFRWICGCIGQVYVVAWTLGTTAPFAAGAQQAALEVTGFIVDLGSQACLGGTAWGKPLLRHDITSADCVHAAYATTYVVAPAISIH